MIKVLAALLLSAGVAYATDPGTASGTMTVGGKKTQLRYAVAKTTENGFDKKKTDIVVLLSNIPVTVEEFLNIGKMMDLSDSGKLTGVEVEITPEKKIISGMLYSPDFHFQGNSFSAVGMHEFEPTKLTKNEAAGKLASSHESSFKDVKFSYSATFDAVVKAPKAEAPAKLKGTPVPAGGGDIGKSYLAFVQNVQKGNMPAVVGGVTAERAKQIFVVRAPGCAPSLSADADDGAEKHQGHWRSGRRRHGHADRNRLERRRSRHRNRHDGSRRREVESIEGELELNA